MGGQMGGWGGGVCCFWGSLMGVLWGWGWWGVWFGCCGSAFITIVFHYCYVVVLVLACFSWFCFAFVVWNVILVIFFVFFFDIGV